ncbi:MAG: hypothetical protein II542_08310, partial [Bacteroidales bacterium]|nr:hypothetical protein [Bacteroidales bacterium]
MKRFILPLLGALVLFAACSEKPQAPDDQTPSSVSFSTSPASLRSPLTGSGSTSRLPSGSATGFIETCGKGINNLICYI